MTSGKLSLYVLCGSSESAESWRERAGFHTDLNVIGMWPIRSALESIHAIAESESEPFLLCQDDVCIGIGVADHVSALITELSQSYLTWGICGNRGVRWDGEHLFDFVYWMDASGLQTSTCAHPVICVDDGLLLVNPVVIKKHSRRAPLLKGLQFGVLLSLECLQNRSLMIVSPRLMALRPRPIKEETPALFRTHLEFKEYYGLNFVNHFFYTPHGLLDMSETVDYRQSR